MKIRLLAELPIARKQYKDIINALRETFTPLYLKKQAEIKTSFVYISTEMVPQKVPCQIERQRKHFTYKKKKITKNSRQKI